MCDKVLVLGSDYGTLQVVKEAHNLGAYVVVADTMETSPTKMEADESWLISTTDLETLELKCRDNGITAIMFGASDFNINNARILCKRLNLPIYCDDDYAWRVARDKGEFKRICCEIGAPVAESFYLNDELSKKDLDIIQFPVVVKPVDASGNRGMSYCDTVEELVKGYKKAREITDNEIIVERRLSGKEYNVHYALANGQANLLYFSSTHHEPGHPANIYSFKNTTFEYLEQYLTEVNDKVIAVLKKAGCREGIAWVDCMRDEDGKFYLLELGYRFGGVMTYVPYEKVIGFNTIRWMLECSLGVKHKAEDLPTPLICAYMGCAASYHLFTEKSGTVSVIEGLEEIEKMPDVYVDMPKRNGALVRSAACMGLIGIYGKNIEDLCNKLSKINAILSIKDTEGENLIIKFDDYEALRLEYNSGIRHFKLVEAKLK